MRARWHGEASAWRTLVSSVFPASRGAGERDGAGGRGLEHRGLLAWEDCRPASNGVQQRGLSGAIAALRPMFPIDLSLPLTPLQLGGCLNSSYSARFKQAKAQACESWNRNAHYQLGENQLACPSRSLLRLSDWRVAQRSSQARAVEWLGVARNRFSHRLQQGFRRSQFLGSLGTPSAHSLVATARRVPSHAVSLSLSRSLFSA